MRRYLRIPAFRYVDDFFGAQRKGQGVGAADLAATFLASVGFNDDPTKRQQLRARMGVLGAEVTLSWMRRMVTIQTSEEKLAVWRSFIAEALSTGTLAAEAAC